MNKEEDIYNYSNPKEVYKKAKKILGKDVEFKISNRKDKKYAILNPETNKWVHFGQMGYQDFTKHKDIERKEDFKKRNHKWSIRYEYSPAYLSYYLLW